MGPARWIHKKRSRRFTKTLSPICFPFMQLQTYSPLRGAGWGKAEVDGIAPPFCLPDRHLGRRCFHTRRIAVGGRSRPRYPYGMLVERRIEAAVHFVADGPLVRLADVNGHSHGLKARRVIAAPVAVAQPRGGQLHPRYPWSYAPPCRINPLRGRRNWGATAGWCSWPTSDGSPEWTVRGRSTGRNRSSPGKEPLAARCGGIAVGRPAQDPK